MNKPRNRSGRSLRPLFEQCDEERQVDESISTFAKEGDSKIVRCGLQEEHPNPVLLFRYAYAVDFAILQGTPVIAANLLRVQSEPPQPSQSAQEEAGPSRAYDPQNHARGQRKEVASDDHPYRRDHGRRQSEEHEDSCWDRPISGSSNVEDLSHW